jgi:DnaK suppressor protein
MITPAFKTELTQALETEKEQLEKDLGRFAKKDRVLPGDYDTAFPQFGEKTASAEENEDEVEEYDKLLSVEHALETRLKEVTEALARIETPNYGLCARCGNPIPKERLKANPAATTCLKC